MLTREEFFIVLSVVHNIGGYPFTQKGIDSLGFSRSWGNEYFEFLMGIDKEDGKAQLKELKISSPEKEKILKSFELFLREIDEYETVSLTDHKKLEVQELYEKLKNMCRDSSE